MLKFGVIFKSNPSFNKYWLNAFSVLGVMLSSKNIKMKRSDPCPPFNEVRRHTIPCHLGYHVIIQNGLFNMGLQK